MMAKTWREIEEMSDEQIVKIYDDTAQNTHVGLNFYRDEMTRRIHQKQNDQILQYTKTMTKLTWLIAGFTIVNLLLVIISLFNS